MTIERTDPTERAIDEVLASMVEGEPLRVSGASVRRAMGESRGSSLPAWLAVAAVLVAAIGVAFKDRAPAAVTPASGSRSADPPSRVEAQPPPSPHSARVAPAVIAASNASRRQGAAASSEPAYEGLPRLTIASLDLPEPLLTSGLEAGPIQIPLIEIAPLSVSSLPPEPPNK